MEGIPTAFLLLEGPQHPHKKKKNTSYLGIVDDEKLHSYINKLIVVYFILFQITTYEKQV